MLTSIPSHALSVLRRNAARGEGCCRFQRQFMNCRDLESVIRRLKFSAELHQAIRLREWALVQTEGSQLQRSR